MSQVEVDKIIPQSGTTLTIGDSGDTIAIASGATLTGDLNASNLTSGTVPDARITGAYTGITNLTMSGDLTVDTDTLYVDSTNNKVGIGTAFPNNYNISANNLVVGSTSGSNGITIVTSTSDTGSIHFADGNTGTQSYEGRIIYNHSLNAMSFNVNNGSERMRIDSSGRVGIGTTSPNEKLEVNGNILIPNNNALKINDTSGAKIILQVDNFNQTILRNANDTRDICVRNAAGTDIVRFRPNGGIAIGGSFGDANTLDDYEEGTWTPTIIGSTTAGTVTMSSTYTRGAYTKIGRIVHIHCAVVWSSLTGTGNLRISGLPFTAKNYGPSNYETSSAVAFNGLAVSAGELPVASTLPSSTEIAIFEVPTGGGGTANLAVDVAGELYFHLTYTTDA